MSKYTYIYLHGFASSHNSSKALYFKQKLEQLNQEIIIPDLNMDDFSNLTLSRQLEQVRKLVLESKKPIIMFGSSMGGATAAILAEQHDNITKLILLAPAFRMSGLWANVPPEDLKKWQDIGETPILHYGYNKEVALKYNFYTDLFKHNDTNFKRHIPTLIFHGIDDDVVPIDYSREYQQTHPEAQLIELDDGHGVDKDLNAIWEKVKRFCEL